MSEGLDRIEQWLKPFDAQEVAYRKQADLDDRIIEYAEYLKEEYGQNDHEALENAIWTGNSSIAKNHPFFSGASNNAIR